MSKPIRMPGRTAWALAAILLTGMALRLGWIWAVNTQPVYDFKHYHDLALSLLREGRYAMPEGLDYIKADTPYVQTGVHYATAFRPPGYPLFLTAVYAVYPSILAAKLANVALSAVWILGMYGIGARLAGVRTGLLAAGLTALFPPAVAYCGVLGTEILAVTLLTAVLWLHVRGAGARPGGLAVLGALMGALTLVKPYFGAMPVLYALLRGWQARREERAAGEGRREGALRPWRAALVALLCTGAAAAAVVAPWTVRNYLVFHRFVPVSTNGDFVLYINNNDRSRGMYMDVLEVPGSIFKTDRVLGPDGAYNEAVAMSRAKEEAVRWIREHPLQFFQLGLKRLGITFFEPGKDVEMWAVSPAVLRVNPGWIEPLLLGTKAAVLVIVGTGLFYAAAAAVRWAARGRTAELHEINLLFVAFLTAVVFFSEGQPRYLFPMYPFFILGVSWLFVRVPAEP